MPYKDKNKARACKNKSAKLWRGANKEKISEYNRKYREKNRAIIRSKHVTYSASYRQKIRDAVLAFLGNKCFRCGFEDKRALQIDHVFSDGAKDRKRFKNPYQLYKIVLKDKSNRYQLLCANCNWIKRYENNELARRRLDANG